MNAHLILNINHIFFLRNEQYNETHLIQLQKNGKTQFVLHLMTYTLVFHHPSYFQLTYYCGTVPLNGNIRISSIIIASLTGLYTVRKEVENSVAGDVYEYFQQYKQISHEC